MIFWYFVKSGDLRTVVIDKVKMFTVTEYRRHNVYLLPVEPHLYEDKLIQMCMCHFCYIFILKIVFWKSSEFVACQNNDSEEWKFFDHREILVPTVEQVTIKV